MEVALLGTSSVKIRSKMASFVIDPNASIGKTDADAVISLSNEVDTSKISELRVIISGPGEYEVKGIKITSLKSQAGILYRLSMDKIEVALVNGSTLSKTENAPASHVVVINADEIPSDKVITSMQPNLVILYGEKAMEAAKTLKEGTAESVNKYAVTFEKLPQEMEVIVLG